MQHDMPECLACGLPFDDFDNDCSTSDVWCMACGAITRVMPIVTYDLQLVDAREGM